MTFSLLQQINNPRRMTMHQFMLAAAVLLFAAFGEPMERSGA